MKTTLLIIEFFAAIILVVLVLAHSAKGEGLAGIGGQARMFNAQKGMEAGLNRLTSAVAVVFLAIAFVLNVFY